MTDTDRLPLDEGLTHGLKAYGSRLRVFLEVALYSGGVLALVAYPLIARSRRDKVVYFLFLALAFVIFHGLPVFIKHVSAWLKALRDTASPMAEKLDAAQIAAEAAIVYEILHDYAAYRHADSELDRIQEIARQFVKQFSGEVQLQKEYSIVARPDHTTTLLVVKERMVHGDKAATPWISARVNIRSGVLDDESSARLVKSISLSGVLLRPENITIKRVPLQEELFSD